MAALPDGRLVLRGTTVGSPRLVSLVVAMGVASASLAACSGASDQGRHGSTTPVVFPVALLSVGATLWTVSSGSDDIREVNTSTGHVIRVVRNACTRADSYPSGLSRFRSVFWLADTYGGNLFQFDVRTGRCLRVVAGRKMGIRHPSGLQVIGRYLWVAGLGGTLTELSAASGSLVRTSHAVGSDGTSGTALTAVSAGALWVLRDRSVIEVRPGSGARMREIVGSSRYFDTPSAIVSANSRLWIANLSSSSLTEIDARTGTIADTIRGPSYELSFPCALAEVGGDIWIANGGSMGDFVTIISASTGRVVHRLSSGFPASAMTIDGRDAWVANSRNQLLEYNAATFQLIRTTSPIG